MMLKYAVSIVAVFSAVPAVAGFGDKLPPEAYLDPVDQEIARTGKGVGDRIAPCARAAEENGVRVVRTLPTEQCVKLLPARRYRGLWLDQFEGSRFCPEPARECTATSPGDKIWLTVKEPGGGAGTVYAVEILARRTMYKGAYGHLGVSDHELIVDRVNTRVVETPAAGTAE